MSGVEIVEVDTALDSSDFKFLHADCPAGKTVLGGGVGAIGGAYGKVIPYRNETQSGGSGWYGEAIEIPPGTGDSWFLRVTAVCANVS